MAYSDKYFKKCNKVVQITKIGQNQSKNENQKSQ